MVGFEAVAGLMLTFVVGFGVGWASFRSSNPECDEASFTPLDTEGAEAILSGPDSG